MKNGFTLAEVLITLGIIGIVAAYTIPTLLANYQKTQYVAKLQKAYTITNQALRQMALDGGCSDNLRCTGIFEAGRDRFDLGRNLIKYIKTVKICDNFYKLGCWASSENYSYDGRGFTDVRADQHSDYKFITQDGMSYAVAGSECSVDYSVPGVTKHLNQVCGRLSIDVNGPKLPNRYGRDIFWFYVTNGAGPMLYPYGGSEDVSNYWKREENPSCTESNTYSWTCAGRVIEEGWQMNY